MLLPDGTKTQPRFSREQEYEMAKERQSAWILMLGSLLLFLMVVSFFFAMDHIAGSP